MDIKEYVKNTINTDSANGLFSSTIAFILALKQNNINPTEAVFSHYINGVFQKSGIIKTEGDKEEIRFILRDFFSFNCELLLSKPIQEKIQSSVVSKLHDDNELTPEIMAKICQDLQINLDEPEEEAPQWLIELQKLGAKHV